MERQFLPERDKNYICADFVLIVTTELLGISPYPRKALVSILLNRWIFTKRNCICNYDFSPHPSSGAN
jgi:hypothetical protein